MKKKEFIEEIKEILLLEDASVDESTEIEIDSMASLLIIAFFDEKFGVGITQEEIKGLTKISDFIDFIGRKNLD
ncbi:hypothetical protein [Flagellimonas baculiformis]|uniref:hypothetical protein n=1 Tax=Flagellimonas baculiformis TaxID=3067310 RepID=UPI00296F887D|nr:hypothetical protein [Muricauda sp. D6]